MKKWLPLGILLLAMTGITVAGAIVLHKQQSTNNIVATTTPPPAARTTSTPPRTGVPAPKVLPSTTGDTTPKAPAPKATEQPTATAPRARNMTAKPGTAGTAPRANRPSGMSRPDGGALRDTFALVRLFHGIGRLEEEGKTPLTAAQAKAVLAVMTPLRTQKTLTPAQAKAATDKLNAMLTAEQKTAIEASRPGRGNWGRQRDGQPPAGERPPAEYERPAPPSPTTESARTPGERPDDRSGARGERRMGERRSDGAPPARMENMNPFNLGEDHPMAKRTNERLDAIFTALEAKAKQ